MSKSSSARNTPGRIASSALSEARKRVKTAKQRVKVIKAQLKEARVAVKAAKTARAQVKAAEQKAEKRPLIPRKPTSTTTARKDVAATPTKRKVKRAPKVVSAKPAAAASFRSLHAATAKRRKVPTRSVVTPAVENSRDEDASQTGGDSIGEVSSEVRRRT